MIHIKDIEEIKDYLEYHFGVHKSSDTDMDFDIGSCFSHTVDSAYDVSEFGGRGAIFSVVESGKKTYLLLDTHRVYELSKYQKECDDLQPVSRKYRMTDKQIAEHPFVKDGLPAFYYFVTRCLGHNPEADDIRFDCRKITIAKNIQDYWMDNLPQGVSRTSLAMGLCMSGPKVNDKLEDNEIEVEEGFIEYEESNS